MQKQVYIIIFIIIRGFILSVSKLEGSWVWFENCRSREYLRDHRTNVFSLSVESEKGIKIEREQAKRRERFKEEETKDGKFSRYEAPF